MPAITSEPIKKKQQSQQDGPGKSSGLHNSELLAPSKGKWIQKEWLQFQKSMMTDVAMLLNHQTDVDLVEAFCSPDSMMTKVAQGAGMTSE